MSESTSKPYPCFEEMKQSERREIRLTQLSLHAQALVITAKHLAQQEEDRERRERLVNGGVRIAQEVRDMIG